MTAELLLDGTAARAVLDHALATLPDECCGVLLGPAARHASEAVPTRNAHETPRTRYRIDPEDQLAAVLRAEEEGLEVVGFYHSHPRGYAAFSEEDEARGSWEGAAYLLLSLSPLAFLAGAWDGEAFVPLDVRVPGG